MFKRIKASFLMICLLETWLIADRENFRDCFTSAAEFTNWTDLEAIPNERIASEVKADERREMREGPIILQRVGGDRSKGSRPSLSRG